MELECVAVSRVSHPGASLLGKALGNIGVPWDTSLGNALLRNPHCFMGMGAQDWGLGLGCSLGFAPAPSWLTLGQTQDVPLGRGREEAPGPLEPLSDVDAGDPGAAFITRWSWTSALLRRQLL